MPSKVDDISYSPRAISHPRKQNEVPYIAYIYLLLYYIIYIYKRCTPQSVKPYLPLAAELSVENCLLMRGNRIVISPQLRDDILNKYMWDTKVSLNAETRQDILCGSLDYLLS